MSKGLNIPELNIPVKYNGKIVGWTNSENPSTIKFVDEESRKLIEKHIEHPIYISSRKMGEIDEDGKVTITGHIEDVIINQNKDERTN